MTKFNDYAPLSDLPVEAPTALPAAEVRLSPSAGQKDCENVVADADRRPAGRVRDDSNPPNKTAPPPNSPAPTGVLSSSEQTAKSAPHATPPFIEQTLRGEARVHAGEATVRQAPSLFELEESLRKTGEILRDRARHDIDNHVDMIVGIKILQFEGAAQMEVRAYQHFYTDLWLQSQREVVQ